MFHLKSRKSKLKIPVKDWNMVCAFLSNLCGGNGIVVERPDNPSASNPPRISLAEEVEKDNNETTATELGSGVSEGEFDGNKSDAWTSGQGTDCKIKVLTRSVYKNTERYDFYREITISASGKIKAVSAEVANVYSYCG